MRYPNHIILDVANHQNSPIISNWTSSYSSLISKTQHLNNTLNVMNSIKPSSTSIIASPTSTVSLTPNSTLFRSNRSHSLPTHKTNSLLWSLFDINFLKKEKMYTKLKYSRSPQYDIVSGGVAALFAGFIGFFISEKFGIELVDSGDFYTFFMYIVFLCFSTRPFFRIMSKKNTLYHFISLKFLLDYLHTLVILIMKFIGNIFLNYTSEGNLLFTVLRFIKTNEYVSTLIKMLNTGVQFFKNYPSQK